MVDASWRSIFLRAGLGLVLLGSSATPSAAHDVPEPVNEGWAGGVTASVTAQTGTVDTFAGAIDAVGEQTFDKDWVRGRFTGVYGTSRDRSEEGGNDKLIQDAQGLFGDWKRTLHERLFWQSGTELSRNSVQDREVRAAFATGPGYRFWEGADAKLEHFDANVGIGYRYELYNPDNVGGAGLTGEGHIDEDHFADAMAGFEGDVPVPVDLVEK